MDEFVYDDWIKLSDKRRLSDTYLSKLPPAPPGRRVTIWDTTPGFGCRITSKGAISFFVMRRRAGERKAKPIRIVLGRYPQLSVDLARKKAKDCLDELLSGIDPRERERRLREAQERERAHTFRAVADLYHVRHLQHLDTGLDYWRYIDNELLWPRYNRDAWRDKPITKITVDDLQFRVEAIRERGKTESARRLFEVARAFFFWAKKQRRYKLRDLPTDGLDATAILGKKIRRKNVLSDEYLRALWRAADKYRYPVGHFVKLLMLTALRRTEVADARWDEFTFADDGGVWTIPAERMKSDAPHVVPITREIAEVLRVKVDEDDDGIPKFELGPFIFSTRGGRAPISGFAAFKGRIDRLMLRELRAMAKARGEDPAHVVLTPWRFHDIRRTVRTHLSALEIPEGDIVRELILAHRRPELHQIYDQHAYFKEKKIALQLWAQRLRGILDASPLPQPTSTLGSL